MVEEEMYLMKTMCLAKKTVQMPTKEEHGFLLFCGLGARKWQVQMECNSLSFKQAILNIYPRLRSAVGYNLWTLTRDKKTFERIPEKVNTPRRIRSYLGSQFTGCLIIVPISDILLMEEKREHLRQMDMKQLPGCPRISTTHTDQDRLTRSLCMLCGKMEKMAGTGSFHKINKEEIACLEGTVPIVKKLTEVLGVNIEAHRKKFIASEEVCKKCLRAIIDISQMEIKLKSAREDLINNFFTTTSRFNKNNHSSSSQSSSNSNSGGGSGGGSAGSTSTSSHHTSTSLAGPSYSNDQMNRDRNGGFHHDTGVGNIEPYSFQQGVLMPSLPRPLAFIDTRHHHHHNHHGGGAGSSSGGGYGGPPRDMYQLCSVAGFAAAAAAANMKNHGSSMRGGSSSSRGHGGGGGSTSSSEQINYVRNPDYRSRPGSDYAASEVGSSSYISVSPPRCEMNSDAERGMGRVGSSSNGVGGSGLGGSGSAVGGNGSTECSEPAVSPRNFDQQSMASTFSFTSQSSANNLLLKSKAQYKDYNCIVDDNDMAEHEGGGGRSVSPDDGATVAGPSSRRNGVDIIDDIRDEAEDYTMSSTTALKINNDSNMDGKGDTEDFNHFEDNNVKNNHIKQHSPATKESPQHQGSSTGPQSSHSTSSSSPTNLSSSSSGPSPPSRSPHSGDAAAGNLDLVSSSPTRMLLAAAAAVANEDSGVAAAEEDSRKPVKKRKRLNNSGEESGGSGSSGASSGASNGSLASSSSSSTTEQDGNSSGASPRDDTYHLSAASVHKKRRKDSSSPPPPQPSQQYQLEEN